MRLFRPFAGLRPTPERAADVVAPPYDVLSADEARVRADGKPWSFLHISKAEIDLPPDQDPYSQLVYQTAASNLQRMIEAEVLVRDVESCYYVYRLTSGNHVQTGLTFAASILAYEKGLIKRHEFTRPQKEDDRVRQIEALNAQTGPALLAYRSDAAADAELLRHTTLPALIDVVADDGVRHQIWRVSGADVAKMEQAFAAVKAFYIADGHHRSAAAARVAAARNATSNDVSGYFLATAFPHNQMDILDYNRVIRDLNGLTVATLLQRLSATFECTVEPAPVAPKGVGEFGMCVANGWYRLRLRPGVAVSDDPIESLDVSILQHFVVSSLFGIDDPRRDDRIDFVGGARGLSELERKVASGEAAVAFSLYPTAMEQLMAVADAGEVMPPKSTWFEPKLADGLLSHVLS